MNLLVLPEISILERIALCAYTAIIFDITQIECPHDAATVGEWEWELIHLDYVALSGEVKSKVEVDGWVTGKAEHSLAFCEQVHPSQWMFPVIALVPSPLNSCYIM